MPILPLNHPEPFAATLGVMLYPGEDEADQRKAAAFAAHSLAEPIRRFHAAGGELKHEELLRLVSDSGARLDDLETRWRDGLAMGELFKVLVALFNTDPGRASWENAIKVVKRASAGHDAPNSRASFQAARARFRSVAHLWGAFCIRDRRFVSRPEVGYDAWIDFQFFLGEAETLREWGQTWRPGRAKAEPPLPTEVWRVPEEWRPPERDPRWPFAGQVPLIEMPAELLATLRGPGRPRKSR